MRRVLLSLALAGALPACCMSAAGAQDDGLLYRGYLDATGSRFDLDDASATNPRNLLALQSRSNKEQLDLAVTLRRGMLTAQAEVFGQRASDEDANALRAYQAWVALSSADQVWYARIGKIVPSWGVGQVWNPVRSITDEQRRDLIFPNGAVEGIELAQVQYVLSADSSISAYALPGDAARARGLALRYSAAVGALDVALSLYDGAQGVRRGGLELSWVSGAVTWVGEAAWANKDAAVVIGPDTVARSRTGGASLSYVAGASIALPDNVLATCEYYHDASGYTAQEQRNFTAALPRSGAQYNPLGNGQDNLYLGATKQILTNGSSVGVALFHNIQSGVSLLRLSAETEITRSSHLLLYLDRYTQSGAGPRVNLYRTALNARLRWNF